MEISGSCNEFNFSLTLEFGTFSVTVVFILMVLNRWVFCSMSLIKVDRRFRKLVQYFVGLYVGTTLLC